MRRWIPLLIVWLALAGDALGARPPAAPAAPGGVRLEAPASGRGFWTRPRVQTAKATTAALGTALLLWGAALRRAGRPRARRRLRDALLALLALASLLGWTNFLQFHYPGYAHPSEFFHYFVGAKYFRELGYSRLYACTAVADHAAGALAAGEDRSLRELASNRVISSDDVLADPAQCTRHFSPARWREFRADVDWIRQRVSPARWNRMKLDHGYNATPVWGIAGSWLAGTGPASVARIRALSLIDPLLLLATAVAVAWAFGWRALCVALLYWGTNYTAQFGWNGGGFLRQDWLAAGVIGICLVRRGRPAAGGFLLATSALLRIFPVLMLAGLAARVGVGMARRRRLSLSASQRRMLLGGLLAPALLLPAAAVTGNGFRDWLAFADNSRLHLATPLLNHAGLKTLLSWDPALRATATRDARDADPVAAWKQGRLAAFERREPAFWLLLAGFAALLTWAVRNADDWVALALGVGAIPIAAELTSYYHSILLVYALLWTRKQGVGVALCALSAAGWGIAELAHWTDEILTWISLATVVFVVYATLSVGARGAPPSELRR